MQKSYLSFFLDFLFYCFIAFLINFVWIRKTIHNNALIWVYSISLTLIFAIFIFIVLKKKIYKHTCSKKEAKEKNQILNSLIFAQKDEINKFLRKFFDGFEIKFYRDFFAFLNPKTNEKFAVFHNFLVQSCGNDFIVEITKKCEKKQIFNVYVFASSFDPSCNKFVKNLIDFKFKLIDFNSFYLNYIKKYNIKPEFKEKYKEKTKLSFHELLLIAFNKTKTKQYFLTGLIFLIGSIFLRYNVYYLVFTTLMFVFCLISHFNKSFNQKSPDPFE